MIDSNNKKYFVISYLHNIFETTASVIKKSNFIVGFKGINKLNRFIKVQKDKTNFMSKNNVIYKILCLLTATLPTWDKQRDRLQTKIKAYINNIRLEPSRHSVITEHILEFKHSFDWKNTKILDYELVMVITRD